jgi:hypothetical protein
MRIRYGRALYGLAAVVAVTTSLGLTAAGSANAAAQKVRPDVTPECTFDDYCSDPVFNVEFQPLYFVNANEALPEVGNGINLGYANDNNPGEDWTVDIQGSVHDLYHLGFLSSAMQLHYRHNIAVEVMYTPYGVGTNLCRGVARNAYQGERVTLVPCGTFPRTLWIVGSNEYLADKSQVKADGVYGGNELISASGTNPSVPYLLTAGGGVWGMDTGATLQVNQQSFADGIVNPSQLWCTATVDYTGTTGPPPVSPPTYTANTDCFPIDDVVLP